jgi:hypothetical protein
MYAYTVSPCNTPNSEEIWHGSGWCFFDSVRLVLPLTSATTTTFTIIAITSTIVIATIVVTTTAIITTIATIIVIAAVEAHFAVWVWVVPAENNVYPYCRNLFFFLRVCRWATSRIEQFKERQAQEAQEAQDIAAKCANDAEEHSRFCTTWYSKNEFVFLRSAHWQ